MVEKKNRRSKMRAPGPEKEIQGAKRGASFRTLEKAVEPEDPFAGDEDMESLIDLLGPPPIIRVDPGSPEGDRTVLSVRAGSMVGGLQRLADMLGNRRINIPDNPELRASLLAGTVTARTTGRRTSSAHQVVPTGDAHRLLMEELARTAEESLLFGDTAATPRPTPEEQREANREAVTGYLNQQMQFVSEFSMEMPTIAYSSDDFMRTRLPDRQNPTFSVQPQGERRNAAAHIAMAVGAQMLLSRPGAVMQILDVLESDQMRAREMHLIFSNSETYFFVWEGTRGVVFDGEGAVVRRGLTAGRGMRLVQRCLTALALVVRI